MKFRLIGKVKSAHGLKGELYVLVFSKETSWLKQLKVLGFESEGETITYAVQGAKAYRDGFLVKLKELSDRSGVESLVGRPVLIAEEHLIAKKGETLFLSELEGFTVWNNEERLGEISKFSSNGAQDLLIVNHYEIPLVEPFIERIDFASRSLHMRLPEGLLEINDSKA